VLVVRIIVVVNTFTLEEIGTTHSFFYQSDLLHRTKFLLYHSARILFFCFLRSVFKHFLIKIK